MYTSCQVQGESLTAGTRLESTRAGAAGGGSFVLLRHFTRTTAAVQALEHARTQRAAGQSPHSQRGRGRRGQSFESSAALATLLRHAASSTSIFRCGRGACPHDSHRGTGIHLPAPPQRRSFCRRPTPLPPPRKSSARLHRNPEPPKSIRRTILLANRRVRVEPRAVAGSNEHLLVSPTQSYAISQT